MKTDDTNTLIKRRIQELMDEKNINENTLATRANIRQSTLNQLMNKKDRKPSTETLKKICEGLEISLHDFFNFYPFNIDPKTPEEVDLNVLINEMKEIKAEISELKKEERGVCH